MTDRFRKRGNPERYSGMVRGVRVRERKHMRHRWQWVALAVVVLLVAVAGGAYWVYRSTLAKIQAPLPNVQRVAEEGAPYNALIVGSDSRRGLSEREQHELDDGDEGVAGVR